MPAKRVLASRLAVTNMRDPAVGSPAINARDDESCPTSDHSGVTHAQSSHCVFRASENNAIVALDPTKILFQEIIGGLSNRVFVTHAGDGSGRIFILERIGRIRILKNGMLMATPFL